MKTKFEIDTFSFVSEGKGEMEMKGISIEVEYSVEEIIHFLGEDFFLKKKMIKDMEYKKYH